MILDVVVNSIERHDFMDKWGVWVRFTDQLLSCFTNTKLLRHLTFQASKNRWKEEAIESNLHLQESQTHTQFFVCEHQTKGLKELKKTDNGTWHLSIFTPCLLQLLPKIEGACLLRFPRWGQLGGNEITFKIRHATLIRPNPLLVLFACWSGKSILNENSLFIWYLIIIFSWRILLEFSSLEIILMEGKNLHHDFLPETLVWLFILFCLCAFAWDFLVGDNTKGKEITFSQTCHPWANNICTNFRHVSPRH